MRRFFLRWWPAILGVVVSVYFLQMTVREVARGAPWWIGAWLSAILVTLTVREILRTRHKQALSIHEDGP
jgi:hypothetical protein